MRRLLKVVAWVFLFPLLLPIWLWRKGLLGRWLAGIWMLLLLVMSLPTSPPDEADRRSTEPTVGPELAQVRSVEEAPTRGAAPKPTEAQAAEIVSTDTPVATATPTRTLTTIRAEAQAVGVAPREAPVATATPSITPSRTPTPEPTATATLTKTAIPTPTAKPTDTPVVTATPTPTAAALAGSVLRSSTGQPGAVHSGAEVAQLVRLVDGDTIDVLVNGQPETVRYIGIDTPERNQPGYRAATEANRSLLGSGTLYLV